MDSREFLRELSMDSGVSGYESAVAGKVGAAFASVCDEVQVDRLGNVVAVRRGLGPKPGPRIMLAAHMDEIGLVVTKVEKGGFARFGTIGGFDRRTLPGQEVLVHGREPLAGVIGARPPHLSNAEERRKSVPMSELYIDLGLSDEQCRSLVSVGDIVTIRRSFVDLQGRMVAGKAMDDRAGVACLLEALGYLSKLNFCAEVYAVATVQEEVGVRGAMVGSYHIAPDLGLAVDACHGHMPGIPEDQCHALDKGPVLDIGPHVHPKMLERLRSVADEAGIPYALEVNSSPEGTDAFAIQMAREGVPTALISLPVKYMHTSVETVSLGDVAKSGKLIAHFVASVDFEFVEGLRCF